MCNQDPEKLESKLIIHASKFTKRDFLEVARLLKRQWMSEALFKIKPTKEMEANDRAGLISLMTALGQKPLEQIPVFLSGLDDFVVQNALNKYTKALEPFYKSERIRDWFKDNIRSLQQRNLKAAEYFDSIQNEKKYELMQFSNICEVPTTVSDQDHYMRTCQMLFKSKMDSWVTDNVKK